MSVRAPTFRMALRFLRRDWRSGELRVLLAAILVAVAAITSVGFFTDRIHLALQQQANELLGADVVISSDHPIDTRFRDEALRMKLRTSENVSFPSMAVSDEGNQLGSLKAVDESYPLRGNLRIARELFAPDEVIDSVPAPGSVWLEPRMFSSLNIKVGDSVSLGAKEFRVDAILSSEPGRGGDIMAIAPRILINQQDLLATQLVQEGSRVSYNLLISGESSRVQTFRQFVDDNLQRGVRVQGIQDARPEIRTALERAQQFLGLAALTSVILAGVAIALAARRFAQRHLDHCAIMRCVGATHGTVSRIFFLQMLILGVLGSITGCVIGFVTHQLLVSVLGSLVGVNLPMPGFMPAILGIATGMVTLLGFALPPLLQLSSVPALRVLRRDLGALGAPGFMTYALGAIVLAVLMVLQAGDVQLGIYMVAGTFAALLFLTFVAWLLVRFIRTTRERGGGAWLFGMANVARRPAASVVQIVAFGLGIMVLLLLTIIRGDLLNEWQDTLPQDAPNRFIINIPPDNVEPMQRFFREQKLSVPEFYPMIRGRLIRLNEKEISEKDYTNERAQRLVEREFNLSYSTAMSPDNILLEGSWWTESDKGKPWVSMEEGIAKTLGVGMGDILTFSVAGDTFTAEVVNIRKVNWDSFKANFFVVVNPGVVDSFPQTYMTNFYLPPDQYRVLNEMAQVFPSITVFDVASIMTHVRAIIARVSMAVEYVFVFTLLAGLMVLYAGIQATHDERLLENALLRTLGGQRKQILQAMSSEFIMLGVLAGILAAIVASVLALVIARFVLNMPMYFNVEVWLIGLIGGGVGVGLAGMIGSRGVVSKPPLQTLRKIPL
ncbi:MAG: FtsX-like permease family protein [Gammaproteobacteria bacterium]|nr:FtsX-like permease family protein [Gammaproteobacteria bacterium]